MEKFVHELIGLSQLERKEKRLAFLRELYSRGVESVYKQMDRTCDEVAIIKINMELQRRKELRDTKIDKVLDNGSNL
jgi:hypothetical protein